MSTSGNTEDLNPEYLRQAIKQIQQELPDLLGSDYRFFSAKLEFLLSEGSNEELLALFALYPVANKRLQDLQSQLNAGHGLYGDSISIRSNVRYECPIGPHYVDGADIQKKDVIGRPLCPTHYKAMKPV